MSMHVGAISVTLVHCDACMCMLVHVFACVCLFVHVSACLCVFVGDQGEERERSRMTQSMVAVNPLYQFLCVQLLVPPRWPGCDCTPLCPARFVGVLEVARGRCLRWDNIPEWAPGDNIPQGGPGSRVVKSAVSYPPGA